MAGSAHRAALPARRVVLAASALVTPVAYFVFVAHYGVNFVYWDQWTDVAMIHAALHGHLTWTMVWSTHNQSRMLFANLLFVVFAFVGRFDVRMILFASATLFSLSFFLLLALYRNYARKWLGPILTILFGAVWFSLADNENALWGYQLGWYLIVFCLMGMMFCLSWQRLSPLALAGAIVLAVIGSYSSLQGLILWPVGLLCIAWRVRDVRRMAVPVGLWSAVGAVTAALYFRGFSFQPAATGGGSVGFALRHPGGMAEYFFAAVGNVIPVSNANSHLRDHEFLGAILTLIALFVFYKSCAERSDNRRVPLPAGLILFAVLFDGSIALARLSFGVAQAMSSRYTMASLLLLLGIATYVVRFQPALGSIWSGRGELRWQPTVACLALVAFMLVQVGWSTPVGIAVSSSTAGSREMGARTVVNLAKIAPAQRAPFFNAYVFPPLAYVEPLIADLQEDHLSTFAPGPLRYYQSLGPL
jgi:hypothetical protein